MSVSIQYPLSFAMLLTSHFSTGNLRTVHKSFQQISCIIYYFASWDFRALKDFRASCCFTFWFFTGTKLRMSDCGWIWISKFESVWAHLLFNMDYFAILLMVSFNFFFNCLAHEMFLWWFQNVSGIGSAWERCQTSQPWRLNCNLCKIHTVWAAVKQAVFHLSGLTIQDTTK